jgi:MFS family permease
MDFRIAPSGRGLAWFQGAIRMLDKNPRGLLMVTLLLVLLDQIPSLLAANQGLSVALSVLLLLCGPALLGGVMFAVAEADAGRPVSPLYLFEGLRRSGARGSLLLLGVLGLLALLLVGVAVQRILGADNLAILTQIAEQKLAPQDAPMEKLAGPLMQVLIVVAVVLFVLLAGWFFAVPRVMFDGRRAFAAFVESIVACAANVLSMTVYGLMLVVASFVIGLALAIVALVCELFGNAGGILLGIVWIAVYTVVLVVSASGNYLAWREVFGHSDPGDASSAGGIVV